MMPMTKLDRPRSIPELAARLAALGYYPVPIEAGNKGPTVPRWQTMRLTEAETAAHFTTAALVGVLHVNVACFDLDVYDEDLASELADEGLRRFPGALERIGEDPKTMLVMRLEEPSWRIPQTDKFTKGDMTAQVDVRTVTRQFVAYGKHPVTQRPYRWTRGELWATPQADLPALERAAAVDFRDWCAARMAEWGDKPRATVIDFGEFRGLSNGDDRPTEAHFLEALAHVPADLGHDAGWLAGLMAIHDFFGGSARGLDVAKDWSGTDSRYNPREVETKWRSFEVGKGVSYRSVFHLARQTGADLSDMARRHRKEPPFKIDPGADLESPPAEDGPRPDFPIDDSATFLSDLRPLEYLIDGILPVGVAYSLTGYPGHGKTTLALQFALSVSRGELFADRQTSKGAVLFLAGENPYNVKWQYAAALAARRIRPEDADVYFVQGRFSIRKWTEVLRAKLAEMPDLKLIIVDSLQAFFEGDNDNDNTQMVEMAHALRGIANVPRRPALLIIAHPAGKLPSKENIVPRGGSAFLAEIDGNLTVWSQDATQQTLHHSPKFRGAGFDPIEWVMQVHQFDHLTDVHGTPLKLPVSRPEMTMEKTTREEAADNILREYLYTVEAGKPLSVRDAAARFGVTRWRMQQTIETAKSEKLIRRHAKTWVITDGGKDFLEAHNAGL